MMQQKTPDPASRDQVCGDVIEDRGPSNLHLQLFLTTGTGRSSEGWFMYSSVEGLGT